MISTATAEPESGDPLIGLDHDDDRPDELREGAEVSPAPRVEVG